MSNRYPVRVCLSGDVLLTNHCACSCYPLVIHTSHFLIPKKKKRKESLRMKRLSNNEEWFLIVMDVTLGKLTKS